MLDVEKIRKDFPILNREINGKKLIYFDNAATSQKPKSVIDSISHYYEFYNANVHRGVHTLASEATEEYEKSRKKVADFIQVKREEVIFTRNTTEAINLVAYTWGRKNITGGDEILVTDMEHHSNLLPWQILSKEVGARLKFIPLGGNSELELKDLDSLVSNKTKLLAITQASNVLGTINPIKEIIAKVRLINPGVVVLVDGAQAVPHLAISLRNLGADFYCFSAHKMLGPTGVGVLWAKKELLEEMPPFLSGGEMNVEVYKDSFVLNALPWKFEAGTPNIADVIGFGAAIDYQNFLGMKEIRDHEKELLTYCLEKFKEIKGIEIYGPKNPEKQLGVLSFNLENIHSHDLASVLDEEGIEVRSGVQCAMPLHHSLKVETSTRASFYLYNTKEEIDHLALAVNKAKNLFIV